MAVWIYCVCCCCDISCMISANRPLALCWQKFGSSSRTRVHWRNELGRVIFLNCVADTILVVANVPLSVYATDTRGHITSDVSSLFAAHLLHCQVSKKCRVHNVSAKARNSKSGADMLSTWKWMDHKILLSMQDTCMFSDSGTLWWIKYA